MIVNKQLLPVNYFEFIWLSLVVNLLANYKHIMGNNWWKGSCKVAVKNKSELMLSSLVKTQESRHQLLFITNNYYILYTTHKNFTEVRNGIMELSKLTCHFKVHKPWKSTTKDWHKKRKWCRDWKKTNHKNKLGYKLFLWWQMQLTSINIVHVTTQCINFDNW